MKELLRALPGGRTHSTSRSRTSRTTFRPDAEALETRQLLSTDVLTYHNDNARLGRNLNETILSPSTLSPNTFGKMFSHPVDGDIYAQPLHATNVQIGAAAHDVVYVATTNNSIYAFDADSNLGSNAGPLWARNLNVPAAGVTAVTGDDLETTNFEQVGIIGTPVIDKASGTMYVDAMVKVNTWAGPVIQHRIHALDITNGSEKLGGPIVVQATVAGTAQGGSTVSFNASKQLQRSALLLHNGVLYVAFASFNNVPYNGWLLGYNASNLQLVSAFCVTPNSRQGSIWMSGGGPAADASGSVYVSTANGKFDASFGGSDYGDSVLRLVPGGPNGIQVADYYTPSDQDLLDRKDQDLGSGGVVLLPDDAGGSVPLMAAADKNGTIYLLNRNNLGGHDPAADHIVHKTPAGTIGTLNGDTNLWLGSYDTPAYFNNMLYYVGPGDRMKAFPVANGQLADTPVTYSNNTFTYPGPTPSISAYGSTNGIVWVIERLKDQAVLRAYDAMNLSRELYNSQMAGTRDQLTAGVKFAVPTVADGKVFVGSSGQFTVFGDLNAGYVNGQRSLISQGFTLPQVYLMLGSGMDPVWHPATSALTKALDREAQSIFEQQQPPQQRKRFPGRGPQFPVRRPRLRGPQRFHR